MKEIKHQQQPTGDTCASACIAMILDKPVENVIPEFHDDFLIIELIRANICYLKV